MERSDYERTRVIRSAYLATRNKWDWAKRPFCRAELHPARMKGGNYWLQYSADEDVSPAAIDVVCFELKGNRVFSEGRLLEEVVDDNVP